MSLRKRLKQTFCIHPCFEDEKHYGLHSGSYVYQCAVCGAYVGHYAPLGSTCRVSKECYDYYIKLTEENK